MLEVRDLDLSPRSATEDAVSLASPGQLPLPHWASISSSVEWMRSLLGICLL